jgi:hypothetical protein
LARANGLQTKNSSATKRPCRPHPSALAADKNFLTLWKNADRENPVLKQAKAERANLHC